MKPNIFNQMTKKIAVIMAVFAIMSAGVAFAANGGGFNANGYNLTANVFVGTVQQWCNAEGITSNCGSYGFGSVNDLLVMKWNSQWNNCNNNGYDNPTYCLGAWVDNEYNGKVPGGDGYVWHYKIIWVGSAGSSSPYWLPGGYSVWGNYEVVMDQGTSNGVHTINNIATPNGYGAVFGR